MRIIGKDLLTSLGPRHQNPLAGLSVHQYGQKFGFS